MHLDNSLWNRAAYSLIGACPVQARVNQVVRRLEHWVPLSQGPPPNMGGDNVGAPEMEVQEIVTNILNVPEQEVPVHKHGHGRHHPRRVESMSGCTAHLDPSGCSVEVYQGVGVKPHILVDVMQDNFGVRNTIQPGSDGPQSGQRAFHGGVI